MFGAVKLTKTADIDKYQYSGYSIGFDRESFSFPLGELGQNVIIFGGGTSYFVHVDHKKRCFNSW